jgi:acyl carrier protein
MSKVTSTCGTPLGADGMPSRVKCPSDLLSFAIGRSPWSTCTSTEVWLSAAVENMKTEAEKNAATDQEAREKIEAKNRTDTMIYQTEKALKDAEDKVPTKMKTDIKDENVTFEELQWDSLDIVQFILNLELEFKIELNEISDVELTLTPAKLAPKIKEQLNVVNKS